MFWHIFHVAIRGRHIATHITVIKDAYQTLTLFPLLCRPNGWGLHFWMINPRTVFIRFVHRGGNKGPALWSRTVKPGRWNLLASTYDRRTGKAKLYVNNRVVARKYIGRFRLATNFPVRMGARSGDRRYFRGAISCMQVYKKALTSQQIAARKRRCFTSTL